MSLEFNKDGHTIAMIKDNKNYAKKNIISVSSDDVDNGFKSLRLNSGYFQPIPDFSIERTCNYIVGASGSGKSRYICEWVKEYKKHYKRNEVYVFSSLLQDESLDPIKPARVILDDDFVKEDINLSIYKDSCCIFDDCDTIQHKNIKNKVYTLMNMMLNTGRHHNITVWVVNHTATGNKNESKVILNEAHSVVYFPVNHNQGLVYMLENYCGLDKKQMKFLKNLNSRWVSIYKHYPQAIITDKTIFMLNELNDI